MTVKEEERHLNNKKDLPGKRDLVVLSKKLVKNNGTLVFRSLILIFLAGVLSFIFSNSWVYGISVGGVSAQEKGDSKEQKKIFEANSNLLSEIKTEQKKIEQKKAFLEEEAIRVRKAREDVARRLAVIRKTEASMKAVLEAQRVKHKKNLESLSRVYQNMKPKDAARVFVKLNSKLVAEIIQEMTDRKAAKIMNVMPSRQAARVTQILRNKNKPFNTNNN